MQWSPTGLPAWPHHQPLPAVACSQHPTFIDWMLHIQRSSFCDKCNNSEVAKTAALRCKQQVVVPFVTAGPGCFVHMEYD